MAFDLNETHQAMTHDIILRIKQNDHRINDSHEGYKSINKGYYIGLHGYFHCMYEAIMTTEDMTPERKSRLNEQINLYAKWV